MAIDNRKELTDGSMRTRSCSLRETMRGWSRTSGDALFTVSFEYSAGKHLPIGFVGDGVGRKTDPASTSGLLCLSTTCEEKFSNVRAAVRVLRTALRYGRSVLDCIGY